MVTGNIIAKLSHSSTEAPTRMRQSISVFIRSWIFIFIRLSDIYVGANKTKLSLNSRTSKTHYCYSKNWDMRISFKEKLIRIKIDN